MNVTLRYSDVEFYNDEKFKGLVKEDGIPQTSTCLEMKLFKFTSNSYADPIQVTDLKISNSSSF